MRQFTVRSERKIHAIDVTEQVAQGVPTEAQGAIHVFTPHTTVSLMLGENEEDLMGDLERAAAHLLDHCGPFRHCGNGNPNAPAHLLSSLAGASQCIPVYEGRLQLGRYQRILLVDLDGPKERRVFVTLLPVIREEG
jgi:secondary thiamine-phosphate synthase enzyme